VTGPLLAALICGGCALLSKEVAAALPLAVLAYDWLLLPGPAEVRRRRLWQIFVPALVVAGLVAAYRLSALAGSDAGIARSPVLNLLTQSIVIWRYLGLLVLPVGQSIMHAVHRATTVADPLALVAFGGLMALAAVAIGLRGTRPLIAFGIIWFLVVIAPSSSVVALREGMAEHRVYLASGGLFMVIAALAGQVLARRHVPSRGIPVGYAAALGLIVLVLGSLTVARNGVWGDPVALWQQAVEASPGMWEPRYVLADSLRETGNCSAAIGEYEAVLRMSPGHRDARLNLGICYGQTGRLEEADAAFHDVLRADPQFSRVYTNLAALSLVRGQPEAARDYYGQAIAIDPKNITARLQLARLYEQAFQDYRAAAVLCDEVRVIAPGTPGATECVERNRQLAASSGAGR
jgi:tetratricopeptide (TPR) repeat protein